MQLCVLLLPAMILFRICILPYHFLKRTFSKIVNMIHLPGQYTVNIFGSKSGHLSNRIIERFFFIFSKLFAVFDDFSKWRLSSYVLVSRVIMNIFSCVFIICTSNVVIHECEARVNTTLRVHK